VHAALPDVVEAFRQTFIDARFRNADHVFTTRHYRLDIHLRGDRLNLKTENVTFARELRISMKHKKHNPSKRETVSEYSFTVFFEPAAEGGYVVTCPALPGLVTEGDTLAGAGKMARDAIRAYLESLRKDGEAIPSDPKFVSDPVKVKDQRRDSRMSKPA